MLQRLTGDNIGMLEAQQKPQFPQKFVGGEALMIQALEGDQLSGLAMGSTKHAAKLPLSHQPKNSIF
jgi:hypothetical protein